MRRQKNPSLFFRLRKTKAALLAVSLTLAGIVLIAFNGWLAGIELGARDWLNLLPLAELGGTLFGAGVLGTLFEYSFRKDQEEATVEQFRRIIKEEAPAMRDAVVDGFAIHPEDLKRVATPELLDDLATNAIALRLGDEQFARELYAEVRDQAIRAAERWHDVEVSIRLSTAVERDAKGIPLFDVTVEWQYTTIPSHSVRGFACVSDRDEFNALVTDVPSTSTWFMRARPGMDASSRDSFELLSFSVDGDRRDIRRAGRKTGQTYTVAIGDDVVAAGKPVRIRHLYRVVTPRWGHRLFVTLEQPARDFALTVDYTATDIAQLQITETVASRSGAEVSHLPEGIAGRASAIRIPGWLLPKTGFTITWSLDSELPQSQRSEAA